MGPLELPRNLIPADGRPGWAEWLASTLPAAVQAAQRRWSLTLGRPFQPGGQTSWVAPAADPSGVPLVLKVTWPHPEAAQEADGLRAWAGNGAVRLSGSCGTGAATVLLIERCRPGTPLRRRPQHEQDTVIAGLLRRLWIEPSRDQPFQPLHQMCQDWAHRFEQQAAAGQVRIDPGLAGASPGGDRAAPRAAGQRVAAGAAVHRPARGQRAGRGPRAVAGHRPQAAPG